MLRMTSILAFSAALATTTATTTTARADGVDDRSDDDRPIVAQWRAGGGPYTRWFGDTSAASLSTAELFGAQLNVARRLITLPGPRRGLAVSAAGRFAGGSSSGALFQTLETRISQIAFTAGPRVELSVWRWLLASAQLDVGAARTSVVIGEQMGDLAPVDDSGWHLLATGWLGVELTTRVRGRVTMSLGAEVGYTVTSAVALHANPRSHPDPELSIPTMYSSLGGLDTRGLTTQMSFRFGF